MTAPLRADAPLARADAPLTVMACTMALSAALVRAASIGAHAHEAGLSLLLAGAALFGLVWVIVAWARSGRVVLGVGMAVHAAFLAFYIVSRVWGVSFVDGLEGAPAVGTPDLFAAFFDFAVVLTMAALLSAPATSVSGNAARRFGARSWSIAVIGGLLCTPALVEASSASTASAPESVTAAASPVDLTEEPTTSTTTTTTPPKPFDPKKPVDLSGTPGVTPAELARSEDLLRRALTELPQWADTATAVAHGYHSIGDGGTGHEHYINWSIIADQTMLDPNHPEALVYNTMSGGEQLEAAMFILPPKYTLDNAPDLGGPLTQWHIHDNLCFTQGATPMVAGVTDYLGNCRGGLIKFTPAPMVHVWITPNPCGPFSALEGIGAGQVKAGETRNCDHEHSSTGF